MADADGGNWRVPITDQPSKAYVRYALLLIAFTSAVHTLDRTLISILIEPVKADLALTDGEVGLLTGMIFALFYTTAAIPIARFADRSDRPRVLSIAVGFWSLMTSLCGIVVTGWQLALFRIGVAVGEAGFAPVSQSIVADMVPKEKHPGALSVIAAGGSVGVMLGLIVGGMLAEHVGWRWTYIIIGAAGIPLALLIALTIREPRRKVAAAPVGERLGFGAAIRQLRNDRAYVLLAVAASICVMSTYSISMWSPAVLMRTFDLKIGHTGLAMGVTVGVASVVGTLSWGYLANLVGRERALWIPIICFTIGAPFMTAAFLMPTAEAAIAVLVIPTFLGTSWYGVIFAKIHERAAPDTRAVAVAVTMFLIGMIGNGFGPTFIGMVSDWLRPIFGEDSLRYSVIGMAYMQLLAALLLFLAYRTIRADGRRAALQTA